MKKILYIFIISLFIITLNVYAKKEEVKLSKCIDGDTVSIIINKEEKKVRFLAVDAPEIDTNEAYSLEAKEFSCNILTNAKKIYLEYDKNSDSEDKYERILAWVWADDILVQKELVKEGYAKIAYLYGDYKYTSELNKFEVIAKENKLNIWGDYKEEVKPTKKKTKKKLDVYLDRLNKSYEILVIVLAGILALITLYLKRKK
ncbi:MAG: thermonuclease family protein [Bacilli bacterium]|nr:thermonuclease family protein [Bacilli bacterium]